MTYARQRSHFKRGFRLVFCKCSTWSWLVEQTNKRGDRDIRNPLWRAISSTRERWSSLECIRSISKVMSYSCESCAFTHLPPALVIQAGMQAAMLETAFHLTFIVSFSFFVFKIHLKVNNQNRIQGLKSWNCRSWRLMAALPLVVASSYFWSLWSQQGWREKVLCCFFKKKHASVIFAAGVLMAVN